MKSLRIGLTLAVLGYAVLGLPALVQAQTVGLVGWSGSGSSGIDNNMGFEFNTTSSITVTQLGFFDQGANGLAASHEVGIWRVSDHALLVSGTVAPGTAVPLDGSFRYVAVTPTVLTPGNYVVSAVTTGDDWLTNLVAPAMSGSLTYVSGRSTFPAETASLIYPHQSAGNNHAPANFKARSGVLEIDAFAESEMALELIGPAGGSEIVQLHGPSTMHVFFEGPVEGDAADNDGNGREEVDTELVRLDVSGPSSFGPVVLEVDPGNASLGQMEEQTNNTPGLLDVNPFAGTGQVDSFFDVFFVIDLFGEPLHNEQPIRLRSLISNKPPGPGEKYENPATVALYDASGEPTGFSVGATNYMPVPEPQSEWLVTVVALAALADLKRRRARAAHRE